MDDVSKDVMVMVRSRLAGVCSFSALLSVVEFGVFGLNRGMFIDLGDHAADHFERLERDEQLIHDELAAWFATTRAAMLSSEQVPQQPPSPQVQLYEQSVVADRQIDMKLMKTATTRRPSEPAAGGSISWQQQIPAAALKIAREMPGAPLDVSRLTMLLLLGYRAAGFNFILISEADLNNLFYWPLITEGLIVEPRWIHDSRQKNKPFTNLVNTHGSAMARVVVAGERQGSKAYAFGITTEGIEIFSGFLQKSGISLSQLNQFTDVLAATVSVPASYREEFRQDPDSVPVI